jgi:hypothetical protein
MFFTQADNLGDALRIQAEPTLAANVVIPKMATVEEYDAQGVALTDRAARRRGMGPALFPVSVRPAEHKLPG